MIKYYKRFWYVELDIDPTNDYIENKMFLFRNFIVFHIPELSEKTECRCIILADFGKDLQIDHGFDYFKMIFKPSVIGWLDRDELSRAIDFFYLFSDKDHLYTKGNFLQDYMNTLGGQYGDN